MADPIRTYDEGGVLREYDPFFVALVEVTAGEINTLYTTEKTLVPAPGAGKLLQFDSIMIAYDWGGTAFTRGSAGSFQVKYTGKTGVAVSEARQALGFIDQDFDIISLHPSTNTAGAGDKSAAANAPLMLCLTGANPSNGNGVFHCRVHYKVLESRL